MTAKHHCQRVDLDTGYIEATRDDTDEMQDLRVKAYRLNGALIRETRIMYNIQYDYCRWQEWINGIMIADDIIPQESYGHLQWENSVGEMGPDWVNPYPDNYEPVKPEGADMFHSQGFNYGFVCYEINVEADVNFYIWDDLEEERKEDLNILTNVEEVRPCEQWIIDEWKQEEEERLKKPFDPQLARDKRLINLRKQCKEIGVDIPIDPRFIDSIVREGRTTVKAIDVANFFIDLANRVNKELMTNLKLNKMLYFAQLHSIARFGEPLFSEDIEAWEHGPVINDDIYQKFKSYGSDPIPITAVSEGYSPYKVFSDKQIDLLLDVEREYRRYSTWELVEITHKEGPWKNARENDRYSLGQVISMKSLEEYASQITPLPEFKVPYSSADVTRFHDADGHLILPKDYEDILDE